MQANQDQELACSVVIPTHNPRREYLSRVIDALRVQTLDRGRWELIVVDNASEEPVGSWLDLAWHPRSRVVREDELGVIFARLRGIKEASGDILVFADDDNVLNYDYLEKAMEIGCQWQLLGSWGAGVITPEFEVMPAAKLLSHQGLLAVRSESGDKWSNNPHDEFALPWGPGLCVRRAVGRKHAEELASNLMARSLGRVGKSLMGAEDVLLGLGARHLNLGWGVFAELKVIHLIPRFKLTSRYFLQLAEERMKSNCLLQHVVDPKSYRRRHPFIRFLRWAYSNVRFLLSGDLFGRAIANASARGARQAERIIKQLQA